MTKFERARERLLDAARDFVKSNSAITFGAIVPHDERSRRRLERAAVAFTKVRTEKRVMNYGARAKERK